MAWESGSKPSGITPRQRERFLAKYPLCRLRRRGCTLSATEVHHEPGRHLLPPDQWRNWRYWVPVCETCHKQRTQEQALASRDDWKRKPEKHPGVLD